MGFEFKKFSSELDEDFVSWLVESRYREVYEKYSKLWNYYQNISLSPAKAGLPVGKLNDLSRNYVQAQEVELPGRITGVNRWVGQSGSSGNVQRKEIVIENDIAWRINAMVDYLFGKGVTICSKASDPKRRDQIDMIIKKVFASAGGVEFFQNMAVLGSVYGFVDCILRAENLFTIPVKSTDFEQVLEAASEIEIDLVEATHSLAVLDETNYKKIKFYIQQFP